MRIKSIQGLTITFLSIALLLNSPAIFAQGNKEKTDVKYYAVTAIPVFQGGQEALMHFLEDNIQYPEPPLPDSSDKVVYVKFIIKKNGEISDVEIARSLNPECDKEALRIMKLMPRWIPAKSKGKFIDVSFVLPFKFSKVKNSVQKEQKKKKRRWRKKKHKL